MCQQKRHLHRHGVVECLHKLDHACPAEPDDCEAAAESTEGGSGLYDRRWVAVSAFDVAHITEIALITSRTVVTSCGRSALLPPMVITTDPT